MTLRPLKFARNRVVEAAKAWEKEWHHDHPCKDLTMMRRTREELVNAVTALEEITREAR